MAPSSHHSLLYNFYTSKSRLEWWWWRWCQRRHWWWPIVMWNIFIECRRLSRQTSTRPIKATTAAATWTQAIWNHLLTVFYNNSLLEVLLELCLLLTCIFQPVWESVWESVRLSVCRLTIQSQPKWNEWMVKFRLWIVVSNRDTGIVIQIKAWLM